MRLLARLDVYLPTDLVERAPGLWDRLRAMWQPVDLATSRARDRIEAATFVYELRKALAAIGIDNARSLVVDGTTVFHDAEGAEGDLPDLVLALSDHVSLFGDRSQELRLSVEHLEAGLHLVLDAIVTSEHGREAPSARLEIVGQPVELDPRPGESAEVYRSRVEPLATDAKLAKTLRLQFGAFVTRLREAMERTFIDTRIEAGSQVLDVESELSVGDVPDAIAPPPKPAAPMGDTASPARNFTLSSEAKVGALLSGPPPFAVRLRRMEDLHEELVGALCECERTGSSSIPIAVARRIEEVNRLIRDHNRYYPVGERNLPMDASTGELLEMGEPWKPRPALTIDGLRARARERLNGG